MQKKSANSFYEVGGLNARDTHTPDFGKPTKHVRVCSRKASANLYVIVPTGPSEAAAWVFRAKSATDSGGNRPPLRRPSPDQDNRYP